MQKLSRIVTQNRNAGSAVVSLALLVALLACGRMDQPHSEVGGTEHITVCDLFKNLDRYRGKVVTISGVYFGNLRESCPTPFITGSRSWPSALNLVDSEYPPGLGQPPLFTTDKESWDRLDRRVLSEARAGRREEIWVTLTGLIRAPEVYVRPDGRVVGGFGHLNSLPAELVVKRVVEIRVRSTPTYDYGQMLTLEAR